MELKYLFKVTMKRYLSSVDIYAIATDEEKALSITRAEIESRRERKVIRDEDRKTLLDFKTITVEKLTTEGSIAK